jgi:2-polyprenyl-3-methyl-5-hydroxy-6-metoxy-1,4-benzoquinol methylase
MILQTRERATYDEMWAVDAYSENSPGERLADVFAEWAKPGAVVLDAGCGSGKGAQALIDRGYLVGMCDLTGEGLREKPAPFVTACLWDEKQVAAAVYLLHVAGLGDAKKVDYVYCCDVMEHIPPTFTMLTVRNLLSVCSKGAFFSIALQPDNFGAWVGKSLHQTVQPFEAWRDQLKELGRVVDARDLGVTGLYMVEPR